MIYPDVDHVLGTIIDTLDQYIAPEVHDEYAASLCLTVSQLLRSMRARVAHEGEALFDDNCELRGLLGRLRDDVDPVLAARIDEATADKAAAAVYVSVPSLQGEATRLRSLLCDCIQDLPDRGGVAREQIRDYLSHQLGRQRPWLVDAFDGPRR